MLEKFEKYCQPHKHVPFERYRFNRRTQEARETYDQYRTALRKLSEGCEFETITPYEILRDRLVFGIQNAHVRGRLLRESGLTLKRTDEVCHAAESMTLKLKEVEDSSDSGMSTIAGNTETQQAGKPAEPKRMQECWNCGRRHEFQKELCPAYVKTCRKCHKPNHFAVKCRSRAAPSTIRTVEDRQEPGSSDETFPMEVAMATLDDSQFVTLRLKSGNHIRFHVDTGAQCNVVPLEVYKEATKEVTLACVTTSHSRITAYGGNTLPVIGTLLLQVWHVNYRCRLDCKLVDRSDIQPFLGRKACIGMKIVTYLDNDKLNKPNTANAPVYALEAPGPMTKQQLAKKSPNVFGQGVGLLEGKYHIKLDSSVTPVHHVPRRLPVPLRDTLRETMSALVQQEIIAPVQKPTSWISSMVVVPKKNGTLCICLDPQDLNRAIRREHYPLPTIEDVAMHPTTWRQGILSPGCAQGILVC